MAIPFLSDISGKSANFAGTITATSYIQSDNNLLTKAALKIMPEGRTSYEIKIGSSTDRHLDFKVGTSSANAVQALRLHYNTLNATFAGDVKGATFNSIENAASGGFPTSKDYLLAGTGDRGGGLIVNDISGARHAISAGGYDLTFSKETDDGSGTLGQDIWMRANAASAAGDVTSLEFFKNASFSGVTTIGPGTTGTPYDSTTFLHVKGTARSIVQQSSTDDAYYMFGDAAANNVAWVGYNHSNNQLELHTSGTTYIDGNTTFASDVTVNGGDFNLTKQNGSPVITMLRDGNNPAANTLLHHLDFKVDYAGNDQSWGGIEHRTTTSGTRTKLNFNVKSTGGNVMNALSLEGTNSGPNATFAGTVTATHFYGDGSNLTGVTVSNADTVDNLHAASFLRSDADDTATGIINFTKKAHDYDTIPPNQNLLDIGSIKIAGRDDIYGNATKTVITDYVAKYVNDNTGGTTIRIYVDDNILVDGDPYMVSVYYENLIGTLTVDFADTSVTGNGSQAGTSSAPKSGRIYGHATRADYTSTFRFVDINLNQGSGHEVTLHSPKVEAGTTLTDFVATERTDMPTNSMHVKDLIATGGIKVVGPASHNFIQSANDYTLGFNDSNGVSQWWIKNYTNGGFAIHENGVGDKFTIAAGGNATFAATVSATRFQGTTYPYNTTVGHTANATTTYIEAGSSSKTSIELSGGDVNSNIKFITPNASNVETLALTIDTSQNATFTGNVESQDTFILNYNNAGNKWQQLFDGSNGWNLRYNNGSSWSSNYINVNTSGNATFAGNVKVKNALIDNVSATSASTTTTVASISGITYAAVFFDYVIYKSSNIRAGTVVACSDGTNVSFTETSTTDLGDTSDVTLAVDYSSSNFRLRATTTSSTWNIKAIIRAI